MAAMASGVLYVAKPSSAFVTPTTKPTTAPAARQGAKCWRIAVFPVSKERTGLARWMSWKHSSGAEGMQNVILWDAVPGASANRLFKLNEQRQNLCCLLQPGPLEGNA